MNYGCVCLMWQAASAEIKEANFLSFHKFNFQFTARFGPRKASPLFTLLILIVKRKGSERSNSLGYVFAFACYKFLSLSFLSVVTRPRQIRDASPAPKRQQMEWQKIFYRRIQKDENGCVLRELFVGTSTKWKRELLAGMMTAGLDLSSTFVLMQAIYEQ